MKITHEKACLCALNRIFGFEPRIALALISHFGSASEVFSLKTEELDLLLGPHSKYRGCITPDTMEREYKDLEKLSSQGISFIGWSESEYPMRLKDCPDAPVGLYIRSSSPSDTLCGKHRAMAIVGTRDLSPYGKEWCERIVISLSELPKEERPVIISGLALGTDICAHRAALASGLPTIGVMATGPENVYPYRHRYFAEEICSAPGSALITDYPPGTAPLAIHFLRRNRIIAGLSEATVLIESKIKGGGMMTARLASSYNWDVYSLPGRIDDIRSQGCNELLRNNIAAPITSIESFITAAGLDAGPRKHSIPINEMVIRTYSGKLSDEKIVQTEKILTAIYNERGITIEEIGDKTGIGYARTSELTGILELDSIISIDLLQRCRIISGLIL
jgi:DNA processing protein